MSDDDLPPPCYRFETPTMRIYLYMTLNERSVKLSSFCRYLGELGFGSSSIIELLSKNEREG